jgi:hypothetical protein
MEEAVSTVDDAPMTHEDADDDQYLNISDHTKHLRSAKNSSLNRASLSLVMKWVRGSNPRVGFV